MALDDQKISMSKLLSRLQENRLAIKSIANLLKINAGKTGRTQVLKQSLLVNSISAISTTLIQVFLTSGLTDLPLTALAVINVWNIAKTYFSNTRLKALMDKKLSFVVKETSNSQEFKLLLEMLQDEIKTDPTKKPKLPDDINKLKEDYGINESTRFKKDEILKFDNNLLPEPITFDILLNILKSGKSEEFFKIKNRDVNLTDKYIDLSPDSKTVILEILKELRAIEKNPGLWQFIKNHQQYVAGAAAAGLQYYDIVAKQKKEEETKQQAITQKIQEKEEKRKLPPPNNSFKRVIYDPKKFGG